MIAKKIQKGFLTIKEGSYVNTYIQLVHPDYIDNVELNLKSKDTDPTYIANQKRLFKWSDLKP